MISHLVVHWPLSPTSYQYSYYAGLTSASRPNWKTHLWHILEVDNLWPMGWIQPTKRSNLACKDPVEYGRSVAQCCSVSHIPYAGGDEDTVYRLNPAHGALPSCAWCCSWVWADPHRVWHMLEPCYTWSLPWPLGNCATWVYNIVSRLARVSPMLHVVLPWPDYAWELHLWQAIQDLHCTYFSQFPFAARVPD